GWGVGGARASRGGPPPPAGRGTMLPQRDAHAGGGPDAVGAGGEHRFGLLARADASRRFDPHRRSHDLADLADVLHRGAARAEARARLDEPGPGLPRDLGRLRDLVAREQAGFDDDLDDRAG